MPGSITALLICGCGLVLIAVGSRELGLAVTIIGLLFVGFERREW